MTNPVLKWALQTLQESNKASVDAPVSQALRLVGIDSDQIQINSQPLESIFSTISLNNDNDEPSPIVKKKISWQPLAANHIVYPQEHADEALNISESSVLWEQAYRNENLALALIEKYGTFLSISPEVLYLSFYDAVKSAAAVHDCLEHGQAGEPFLLISGDFSGIQETIYTIASRGALKTLRARSFMLELLTEHIVYEIQQATGSGRYSLIFSGGGGFSLLVPNTEANRNKIKAFVNLINEWSFEQFGFQLFLALHCEPLNAEALKNRKFKDIWESVADQLAKQKRRKFWDSNNFQKLFCPEMPKQLTNQDACQITHRDDLPETEFALLNNERVSKFAYRLWELGDQLTAFDYVVRLPASEDNFRDGTLLFPTSQNEYVAYKSCSSSQVKRYEARWLVNSWNLNDYRDNKTFPFLFGKYVRSVADLPADAQILEREEYNQEMDRPEGITASFSGLAKAAQGSDLIGCLRMDVDDSGDFLSQGAWELGLGIAASSNLSRSMNLFFKGYLNQICGMKLGDLENKDYPVDITGEKEDRTNGRDVSIVYAGGDDLFIVGAWDDIAELAFDINACFNAFSCDNPDVHLSGGVTLHKPKFPLYQMARMAKQAEAAAKHNETRKNGKIETKKSLALFYSDNLKMRNISLNKQIDAENTRTRVHGWIQENDRIAVVSQWAEYSKVIQLAKELNKVYPVLPHGFSRKLFETLRIWQEEGQLYMPMMFHTLRQFDPTLTALKTHLFRQDQMPTLHLPLHWVEYLNRQT